MYAYSQQEAELVTGLEKLRAEAKKVRARLTKMEEEQAKIKFPVKDELLVSMLAAAAAITGSKSKTSASSKSKSKAPAASATATEVNSSSSSSSSSATETAVVAVAESVLAAQVAVAAQVGVKPLPAAVLQVGAMLPEELVNDAIGVWDFLTVFR